LKNVTKVVQQYGIKWYEFNFIVARLKIKVINHFRLTA